MKDDEFEKYVKEEFDKMIKDYDRIHDVLWGALENRALSDYKKEVEEIHNVSEKIISEGRAGGFLLSIGINDLLTDKYICDCEKNYGKACKYPEKYKDGGCK